MVSQITGISIVQAQIKENINEENVSIWWRRHELSSNMYSFLFSVVLSWSYFEILAKLILS